MDVKALFADYYARYKDVLLSESLQVLLILVGTFIVSRVARIIINRIFGALKKTMDTDEMRKRADTLASLLRYVSTTGVYVLGAVMLLDELGIEIGPILAAAGVLGLAVGFGAQTLVQDIISGFFILMEDQIRVGDVIETGGKAGVVEKVNLRMVILRDLAGNVHYIRNGKIDIVTNMTKEFSFAVLDIGVAYRENVDEVCDVMRAVDEDLRRDPDFTEKIMEPIEILGLDKFDDSAVVIKARIKTRPIKQWNVAREYRRRLKIAFDTKGIEIPFPHITLYAGQGKDGTAPPFPVVGPTSQTG